MKSQKGSFFFFLVSSFLFSCFLGSQEGGAKEQKLSFPKIFSLKECLDIAQKASDHLDAAKWRVCGAKATKDRTLSPLLPQLSLKGKIEGKNTARDFSVFSEYGGAFSANVLGLSASWLLFDFGSSWKNWQAGGDILEAEKQLQESVSQKVEEEVCQAYFRLLENESAVEVIQSSVQLLEAQLKSVQDLYDQGVVSWADLGSVEVLLAEKRKNLLQAKQRCNLSRFSMNRLLGLEPLYPLVLEDHKTLIPHSLSQEELFKKALKRPDILAMEKKIDALQKQYEALVRAFFPKISAFGDYSYLQDAPNECGKQEKKHWISGGIGFSFSLYDGGGRKSEADKIRAQKEEVKANLQGLEKAIEEEIYGLVDQLKELKESVDIDKTSLGIAEKTLLLMEDRYREGLVSIQEVLRSEEQFIFLKINYYHSLYQYHIVEAHLKNVTGGVVL